MFYLNFFQAKRMLFENKALVKRIKLRIIIVAKRMFLTCICREVHYGSV